MLIYDSQTLLPVADAEINPLPEELLPTTEALNKAISTMILSASGWRKIFARSGNPQERSGIVDKADLMLAAFAASIHADYLKNLTENPSVIVGVDSRPTGPSIADTAIRVFLAKGVKVEYLFITAAPEIMAYNLKGHGDGFFYISASHNPIGYNGIKFGGNGGVYPGSVTGPFADRIRSMIEDPKEIDKIASLLENLDIEKVREVLNRIDRTKADALRIYKDFILEVADTTEEQLKKCVSENPVGIVGTLNGSARTLSIDQSFLRSLGVSLSVTGGVPGRIETEIVPEGENLIPCKKGLEAKHKIEHHYMLGYMPDNDGDRGNIVVFDNNKRIAIIPEAQEVFALAAMISLSETRMKNPDAKVAIAVNGPTSLRINRIAYALDVELFRSEVGEANVVQLADSLRKKGYIVNILGEGSNGGNISHPARVRDPMNTIVSLLKLRGNREIITYWCRKTKQDVPRKITVAHTLSLLPGFTTTGSFSDKGVMQVSLDPGTLKTNYEKIFVREWEQKKDELKEKWGICGYTVYQSEGTKTVEGIGEENRHAPFKGGWKACFTDKWGVECAFIWMRPSGTEPVFRVSADSEGRDKARHDFLLDWHRSMVKKADGQN